MQIPTDPSATLHDSDRPNGSPQSIVARAFALIERRASILAVALLIIFFCLQAHKSQGKPIWFDEIFTSIVAMQPDWHHFLGAMPAEGNPPLSALLTKLTTDIFGVGGFGLRLPQMLGFTAALAGVYLFVRRECGAVYGLLAMMLALAQPAWKYSIEARPYGLLMACFMLALLGWQAAAHAVEGPRLRSRTLSLTLMAAGIAGCILSHNIGIVAIGSPLLLGEAVRTLQRRRFDWQMIAAQCLGFCTIFITLPMIHRTHQVVLVHVANIALPLNLHKLWHYKVLISYSLYQVVDERFTYLVVLAILIAGILHLAVKASPRPLQSTSTQMGPRLYIGAAAVGALALIPITWLAMIPAGGWFYCRYGIGTAVGIALVACFVLNLIKANRLVLLFLIVLAAGNFANSYRYYRQEYPMDPKTLAVLVGDTSGLPIAITDPFRFPALWWHAPPNLRDRLYYVAGPNTTDSINEAGVMAEKPYWKANIEDASSFLNRYDRARVFCATPASCTTYFPSVGFKLLPLEQDPIHYFEIRRANPTATESK